MQNTHFTDSLQNQRLSNKSENRTETDYNNSILLGVCGGLICGILAFLLFIVYALAGKINRLENFAGVCFLVIAFAFFAAAAHFMDKAEENKRSAKKLRAEKFMRNDRNSRM